MSFQILVTVWCAASLLVGGGLVVWFVVEMKLLATWWSARRAHRHRYVLPKARWVRRRMVPNGIKVSEAREARPKSMATAQLRDKLL